MAAGAAYARRRQPCPQAIVPAGDCPLRAGCPCKGVLVVVGRPLTGGLGRSRLPLVAGLPVGGRPCMGAGRGWPPLLLAVLAVNV
ncbi:hypothetical protein GW17_00045082 [Ensete ventricosum]|nr:hypothetical protein GW17_00045082 [Ensete ventricosum]